MCDVRVSLNFDMDIKLQGLDLEINLENLWGDHNWCTDNSGCELLLESILSSRVLTAYYIMTCKVKRLCKICHISAFLPHNINWRCGLSLKMYK